MPLLYVVGEIKRCIESRTHVVRCAEKQSIEVERDRSQRGPPLAVRRRRSSGHKVRRRTFVHAERIKLAHVRAPLL